MGAVGGLEGRSAIQRDHEGLDPPGAADKSYTRDRKKPIRHCSLGIDWEAAFWKWVMVNKKLS